MCEMNLQLYHLTTVSMLIQKLKIGELNTGL